MSIACSVLNTERVSSTEAGYTAGLAVVSRVYLGAIRSRGSTKGCITIWRNSLLMASEMVDSLSTVAGRRSTAVIAATVRLLVVLLVLLMVAGGSGVAVAEDGDNPGNPGRSCPGENPNKGFDRASEEGRTNSEEGIRTAFQAIGCSVVTLL